MILIFDQEILQALSIFEEPQEWLLQSPPSKPKNKHIY